MKRYSVILVFLLLQFTGLAEKRNLKNSFFKDDHPGKGINIYIISKDKYFDLTNRIIVWQAKLAAFFHSKRLK